MTTTNEEAVFSKFQTSYNPFNSNSYTQINITVAKLFSGKKTH